MEKFIETNRSRVIPQKIRLQRRLFGIYVVCFQYLRFPATVGFFFCLNIKYTIYSIFNTIFKAEDLNQLNCQILAFQVVFTVSSFVEPLYLYQDLQWNNYRIICSRNLTILQVCHYLEIGLCTLHNFYILCSLNFSKSNLSLIFVFKFNSL